MHKALPSLLALGTACLLGACMQPYSNPHIVAPEGQDVLVKRVRAQIRDLEQSTGKRFRGETVEIRKPVRAKYTDWRGMPVAKIRGRYQGGLTSWKVLESHATVHLAHAKGTIPDWLVRHESLHVILLSNGIPGHPRSYARHFDKPYWWLPENRMRRGAVAGARGATELEAACCPICGVDVRDLIPIE